jgi:predicted GIY-YIG superfamily endonuclease
MPVGCQRPLFLYSMSLLMHLREYRQLVSSAQMIPIYRVFGDTVIKSIAQDRPGTELELAGIRGLTDEKRALYGSDILKLVAKARKDDCGTPRPPVIVRHARRTALDTRRRTLVKAFDASKTHRAAPKPAADKEGVYVLELAQGRVYVGHSGDVRRRIQQHVTGQGSAFTKAFPPTGVLLPRLGCVTGSAEAAERDETLRYMFLRGFQFVRGWRYVRVQLSEQEVQDAEENIRELFDLCRRCGHPGHFITQCKANFDRLGQPCKPR